MNYYKNCKDGDRNGLDFRRFKPFDLENSKNSERNFAYVQHRGPDHWDWVLGYILLLVVVVRGSGILFAVFATSLGLFCYH